MKIPNNTTKITIGGYSYVAGIVSALIRRGEWVMVGDENGSGQDIFFNSKQAAFVSKFVRDNITTRKVRVCRSTQEVIIT